MATLKLGSTMRTVPIDKGYRLRVALRNAGGELDSVVVSGRNEEHAAELASQAVFRMVQETPRLYDGDRITISRET